MQEHSKETVEILRRPQVEARTGLSRSTIYQRMKDGTFPTPISLGSKAVGWLANEIDAWLAERVRISRPSPNVSTNQN
ncbi:MAG TPA: AlpA family transcriptional regulator [Acidobacteriaceae bacterium]|jgi:prophage regulatory protein|nr:AlpA family transcriptional regulator [Acidobacteriaceae bacterium]